MSSGDLLFDLIYFAFTLVFLTLFPHLSSSSLADVAVGKKVVHIPYRDSALTKLLQSALGGNSRTVMVSDTHLIRG